MTVIYNRNGLATTSEVYDVTYDKNGYPRFLIYNSGEWKRVSARYCTPAEESFCIEENI